jgi:hypothetical protein
MGLVLGVLPERVQDGLQLHGYAFENNQVEVWMQSSNAY